MRRMRPAVVAVAVLLLAGSPALALNAAQFRQLTVLADNHVADVLPDGVAWLADERGLVIGGWEEWPTKPVILIAPAAGQSVALDKPATPYFALSPSRQHVAYWTATGGAWAQLKTVSLVDWSQRYVGDPRRVASAMHLAWPTDHTLCALVQDGDISAALAINTTTSATRPIVSVEGGQWVRLRKSPGSDPIAVWSGAQKKCFALSPLGRTQELSPDLDFDRARPSESLYSYFDEQGALWLGGVRDRAPTRLTEEAGASCWAPDATMLLWAGKRALWSIWPQTMEQRQVMGSALDTAGLAAGAPCGMSWSGDGGVVAYWRQSGVRGQIRRATLGLQEVVIRARFDKGVPAAAEQRVWVAKKLHFDDKGRVTEPVWETVKGEFAIRKLLPGTDETIVEAVSIGAMPGVLVRIAGRSQPQGGAVPGPTLSRFSLKPIPELIVWLHGTHHVGALLGIDVCRAPLGAPK